MVLFGLSGEVDANDIERVSLSYEFKIGPFLLGKANIATMSSATSYSAAVIAKSYGMFNLLRRNVRIEASVRGWTRGHDLEPSSYLQSATSNGEVIWRRSIQYAAGKPVSTQSYPEQTRPEDQVELTEHSGTVDPITVIFSMIRPGEIDHLCGRQFRVFDGQDMFGVSIGNPVWHDDLAKCTTVYRRLESWDSVPESPVRTFDVEYAPIEENSRIFRMERTTIETRFGKVKINLAD